MRVAQIIHDIHNPCAGLSYSVERLAHWLAAQGHESEIMSLGTAPARWDGKARLRLYGVAFTLLRDCRDLGEERAVLHDHGVWRLANLFPLALPHASRSRTMCSPRGMLSAWSMAHKALVKRPFWSLLQKRALERVHCFHATAEHEATDIRALGFRQPIAVIPNGVEVPVLSPGERRNEILFLGRIAQEKGIDLLLPLWRQLAPEFPAWRLRIAGPLHTTYAEQMRARAEALGLVRCEFLGELQGAEKSAAFASARLFVQPSYTENFGIAIAEALAHALPVVTTTATPWTGLVQHGCGWRVPAEPTALAAAMRDALTRPAAELESMGRVGRDWIARDFGWDAAAARMASTYEWLLASLRGRPPEWVHI